MVSRNMLVAELCFQSQQGKDFGQVFAFHDGDTGGCESFER